MSDKQKILDRLKKLLALAGSSNPNEAAVAFKQAQKLMQAHALSDLDVDLLEVCRADSAVVMASMPQSHTIGLANLVETAFGCRVILSGRPGAVYFSFVGVGDAAEIACYVFDVLLRQLNGARKSFIATSLDKRLKRSTKTRRADLYCRAWVTRIAETIEAFVMSDRDKALIESYWERNFGQASQHVAKTRSAQRRDTSAYIAGLKDAAGVTLNRAMKGSRTPDRLGVRQ